MEYSHLLREADLKALRAVLGHPVVVLLTRTVHVRQHVVIAPYFSLDLGGGGHYCTVESDWNDTPQTYLDYHMIAVTLQDWPKGVARVRPDVSEAATGRWWPSGDALGHPSYIQPEKEHGVVDRIKVLEYRAASDSESVYYDHALVFSFADGYQFALSAHKSILGGLEFSEHEPTLRQLCDGYPERLYLGAQ